MSRKHRQDDSPPAKEIQEARLSVDDYGLSWLVALQTGSVWGHCYENSYASFFAFPALFDPSGRLIEGWMVFEEPDRVVLMEHGWLAGGSHIIDPTIVFAVNPGQPVYYFPGVERGRSELERLENQFFPHVRFCDYGADGMGHPGYRAAFNAAHQKARLLCSSGKALSCVRATMLGPQEEARGQEEAGRRAVIVLLPDHRGREETDEKKRV